MPEHSPCPAKGGIWWAASPASSIRPARQRSAQRALNVYTVWRWRETSSGPTPGGQ